MIDVKIIKKPKSGRAAIGGGIATAGNSYTNDSQQTLADVLNFNAAVSRLLQPYDANNQPLAWAQATDPDGDGGIKAKTLRASVTFASVGDIVAYQNGNLSGGTGGGGLDITALEDYLTTNGYATQTWVSAHFNDYVLTKAAVEAVLTGNITTHTHNQYLTEHQSLANYMTRGEIGDTYQTKSAALSFTAAEGYVAARFTNTALAASAAQNYIELWGTDGWFNLQAGHLLAHGAVTATSFVKTGGTATQFLKADGSVDSNSYLLSSAYTAADILTKIKAVDGAGSGLDADMLDGVQGKGYMYYPAYNFGNGYLVRLKLLTSENYMVTVHIRGNSYNALRPIDTWVQFYNYNSAASGAYMIIAQGAIHNGYDFGNINVFGYDGHVYLWFKQTKDYQSFSVYAQCTNSPHIGNLVEDITNKAMPQSGVSGLVTIVPMESALITDNVASATKLQTARTINGTAFDGTAAITTAKWGTARNLTIGNTAKSVDGSSNVAWSLAEIGALGVNANAVSASKLQTAHTLWGQSFDGTANVSGSLSGVEDITFNANAKIAATANHLRLLTKSGGPQGIAAAQLLASDLYSDWSKVPANGIYSKGDIATDGSLKIGGGTITWDAGNNAFMFSHTVASQGDMVAFQNGNLSGGTGGGGLDITALEDYLTTNGYATQDWVSAHFNDYVLTKAAVEAVLTGNITTHTHSQYLTVHQSLANYVTLNTPQAISGAKTFNLGAWVLKGDEYNDITARHMNAHTWGNGSGPSAIRHGLDFKWYYSHWVIGNIRGDGVNSVGFGIGELNSDGKLNPALQVTATATYINNFEALHKGNYTSILDGRYALKSVSLAFSEYTNYLVARFNDATFGEKAADTYIEFWQGDKWFNFKTGWIKANGKVEGTSIVKTGGTATQFLKADGSVDSNTYLTTGDASDTYLPKLAYTAADILTKIKTVDGAGSGLDADLLDGKHREDILRIGSKPTAATSLNDRVVSEGIDFFSWDYAHAPNVNGQPAGDGAASAASVVTFGGLYPFQIYSDFINTDLLYYRSYYPNKGWQAWRQFAFVDSNVASATKLQTARKLWGQSFDGTANVSGSLSGVEDITFNANAKIVATANHIRLLTKSGGPQGIAAAQLLASDLYADWAKVPANGIYSKGDIATDGSLKIGGGTITWDAGNNAFMFSHTVASQGDMVAFQNGNLSGGTGGGGLDITALEDYLTTNGYATQDWVSAHFNDYVLTKAAVEAVLTGNITTHTHNQYLTEHQSLANYMTRGEISDTYQAKSTALSFTAAEGYVAARFTNTALAKSAAQNYIELWGPDGWFNLQAGYLLAHGAVTATQFIKTGGTASQFLKADGSVDSNTYLTTGAASDTYLPKLAYTASDILTKIKTVDGAGSGLDADTLDGVHGKGYVYYNAYNFSNGCLVRLKLLTNNNGMVTVHIHGNSYDKGLLPINTWVQFYYFETTGALIDEAALHNGYDFGNINVFCYDRHIYMWFKQTGDYQSFSVYAECTNLSYVGNLVEKITNAAMPTEGVTRLKTIVPKKSALTTDNVASATKLKTARTINGTAFDGTAAITTAKWGTARNLTIGNTAKSVDGSSAMAWSLAEIGALGVNANAVSASKLATPHTLWGQSFDGTDNVAGTLSGVEDIIFNANARLTAMDNALRFFTKNGGAQGIQAGNLLISDLFSGANKVPENGIYSKDGLVTDGSIKIGGGTITWDEATNSFMFSHTVASQGDVVAFKQ